MAATCELEHKETGKKTWHYSVDAKEILARPGTPYKLTGRIKRSGRATPSGVTGRAAVPARTQEEVLSSAVARGVVEALQAAGNAGHAGLAEGLRAQAAQAGVQVPAVLPETPVEEIDPREAERLEGDDGSDADFD